MKKIKFDKKLSLNKETIAKLNDEQMNGVKGGRFYLSTVVEEILATMPNKLDTVINVLHTNRVK